jgi:hypothetical protein
MFVWSGSSWAAAGSAVNGTAERQEYVATSGQTNFAATYDVGFVDVYLNGVKLIPTSDFTATDGATIILTTGAVAGDNVSIIAYGAFNVADVYTQAQSDARYAQIANVYNKTDSDARYTQKSNNLSDLDNAATALTNLGLTATAAELNYVDGVTSNIQTQIDNIDALPSQTGQSGKFLTTDGISASWINSGFTNSSTIDMTSITEVEFTDIPSGVTLICITIYDLIDSNGAHPTIELGTSSAYKGSGYRATAMRYRAGSWSLQDRTTAFMLGEDLAAPNNINGSVILTKTSDNHWSMLSNNVAFDYGQFNIAAGGVDLGGELTRLKFRNLNGNFSSGKIGISYL